MAIPFDRAENGEMDSLQSTNLWILDSFIVYKCCRRILLLEEFDDIFSNLFCLISIVLPKALFFQ